jgi:hypothetical protein
MEIAGSFVIFRFLISAVLAAGGIACIYFGYCLFRDGSGVAKAIDKFDLKSEQIKISTAGMSVGAVLMLTSGAWGYFATSSIPKFELAGLKIGNNVTPVDEKMLSEWAGVIGKPVVTKDKQPIGQITGFVKNARAKDGKQYLVQSSQSNGYVISDTGFNIGDPGQPATTSLSKAQLEPFKFNWDHDLQSATKLPD